MAFSTKDEGVFACIGKRPSEWTYSNGLTKKSLKFGSKKRTRLIVGKYSSDGTLICGGANGYLYCFKGS